MKDSLRNEVEVGDGVAYISGMAGSNVYLSQGKVIGITPKNFRVVSVTAREGAIGFLIKPTRLVKLKGKENE